MIISSRKNIHCKTMDIERLLNFLHFVFILIFGIDIILRVMPVVKTRLLGTMVSRSDS